MSREQANADRDNQMARLLRESYSIDDATFEALTTWCSERTLDWARDTIVEFLEASTKEDAEYSLSHGFEHVAALALEGNRNSPYTSTRYADEMPEADFYGED